MTFEEWLTELAANSLSSAAETRKIAPESWGSGYDTGYSDALEHVMREWSSHSPQDATE